MIILDYTLLVRGFYVLEPKAREWRGNSATKSIENELSFYL